MWVFKLDPDVIQFLPRWDRGRFLPAQFTNAQPILKKPNKYPQINNSAIANDKPKLTTWTDVGNTRYTNI